MAESRTLQQSFAGGEVTPEFFARLGDAKFQSGAATLRNVACLPHGPARQRPGFRLVREVKDSSKATRLIEFAFSSAQTLVIEFGEGYFRFHTQGATVLDGGVPYEVAHTYTEDELFEVNFVQSADIMTLLHPSHRPAELRRLGPTNWTLVDIDFTSTLAIPTGVVVSPYIPPSSATGVSSDTYQPWSYVVTALTDDGAHPESGPSAVVTVETNLYLTGAYNTISWDPVEGATRYIVYKDQGGLFGYIGETTGLSLRDDNVEPDVTKTPPNYDYSLMPNGIAAIEVTAGGSNYGESALGGGIQSVVVTAGGRDYPQGVTAEITDPTGEGAVVEVVVSTGRVIFGGVAGTGTITRVNVVEPGDGYTNPTLVLYNTDSGTGATFDVRIVEGITRQPSLSVDDPTGVGAQIEPVVEAGVITGINVLSPGWGYTNPSVVVDDAAGGTGATFGDIDLTGEDYPGAVSYFEQRRVFAGTLAKPHNLWTTRSGDESAMSYSIPLRDDDRIAIRLAARDFERILHIVPILDLVLLTSGGEWRLTSVNSDAITPTTVAAKPQAGIGANHVRPIVVNNSILYAAARGGHIREMGYRFQDSGYVTGDLSLRAPHLFDGYTIVDSAYSKSPYPIVWFVSSSGDLLGITYVPDQQVGGWHHHDTQGGAFESCCVVQEGAEDHLYVVVNRGGTRYIERMADWFVTSRADRFCVDSGLSYDGRAQATGITLSNGSPWTVGSIVRVTAQASIFTEDHVGQYVTLDNGDDDPIRLEITSYISGALVDATAVAAIPVEYQAVLISDWSLGADIFAGLDHLEGETVSILADGAVMPRQVVSGGQVEIDEIASVVHIGLPVTADLGTLPVANQIDGAFGQGRHYNVNKVFLRLFESGGVWAGPDETQLQEAKIRDDELLGDPPDLQTGLVEVEMDPSWRFDGQVLVRNTDPLPMHVTALLLELAIGG